MPKPRIERGRNQILYNYGPEKVFWHEATSQFEKVVALQQDPQTPQLRLNMSQLEARMRREIGRFAASDVPAKLLESTPIHVVQPDWVVSRAYPLAYYCQDCGHLYLVDETEQSLRGEEAIQAIRKAVPSDWRCSCTRNEDGQRCEGPLMQYDVLTTHNCGSEVFSPTEPYLGRCKEHGADHLHWYRQGSERASRWRISCERDGCDHDQPATFAFYGKHFGCPLEEHIESHDELTNEYHTAPVRKATHYMARVVNLLNSVNTLPEITPNRRSARVAAFGVLRHASTFRNFDPGAGFDRWQSEFDAPGRDDAEEGTLDELVAQRKSVREHLPEGDAKDKMIEDLTARIQRLQGGPSGGVDPGIVQTLVSDSAYTREVRDTALYMDSTRSLSFDDLMDSSKDEEYLDGLEEAKALLAPLKLHDVRYQRQVPLTTALIGFTRGSYEPKEAKLNLFVRRGGDEGLDVYANQTETEGIWIQLDPTETLRWLNARADEDERRPVREDFSADLLTLQEAYEEGAVGLFGEFADDWTQRHFGLLHTISHLFIRAAGRVSGLEQEGISEELLPFTNSFIVYANHSGEFTLGGLQLMMEHHMASALRGLKEDAHRCVYNPICATKNEGACHGCVYVGEVSCQHFNRTLSRNHLIGENGFWSDT